MNQWIICLFVCASLCATGADLYVDYAKGRNTGKGSKELPFDRFGRAIAIARPGDTIYILPHKGEIRDHLFIRNKKGEKDKPIVIDAMFNTFTGADKISAKWKLVDKEKGLYHWQKKMYAGYIYRFAMVMRGKLARMGRHTKFTGAPLKKLEDLKEYEWTIVGDSDFYFRIPAGMTPEQAEVEELVRDSGVAMSGNCEYITIRNMIATRVWNDGYNIHDKCFNIKFENVAAVECMDDGISAHEVCTVTVKNMLSLGNGTGFCHVQDCEVIHENIYIAGSDSRDIFLLNKFNKLVDITVNGTAPGPLSFLNGRNELNKCSFVNHIPGIALEFVKTECSAEDVVALGYKTAKNVPAGFTLTGNIADASKKQQLMRDQLLKIFGKNLPANAKAFLK